MPMIFIEKIKNKKWEFIFVAVLILAGIFLRSYNFSDWLHFEIDQDYDILLVDRAVENGISNLPLLGPNAGGGLLRLGPAYYYIQYVSAIIFGNTPAGNAAFVLIFSILSLPLFYIFSRRYFSTPVSIGLLAILSVSLFAVLYSRFAWSPNILPFLMLLIFYSLLRSVSEKEEKRGGWFLLSVFATAVITQIHFNVFFVVPAIFIIFLAIKRPRFNFKIWLGAIAIVLLVYSPMVANYVKTNGRNVNYFLSKTAKASPDYYNLDYLNRATQNLHYIASEFFVINSGIDYISGGRVKEFGFQNDERLPWRIGAIVLFLAELYCFFHAFFRFKEKEQEKKDFLILCGLWFSVFSLYFFFLLINSYHIFPRFFLPLEPLAIIFFGFLLEKIKPELSKKGLVIFSLIIAVFCVSNLSKIRQYFAQLSNAETNSIVVETEDVLPNTARITLQQQNDVVDYIESIQRQNNYPVYIKTLHELEPAIWYRLEKDGIDYKGEINQNYAYREGNYFLVFPTSQNKQKWSYFSNIEAKTFGSLTVARVDPDPSFILFDRQNSSMDTELEVKKEFNEISTWGDFIDSLRKIKEEEPSVLYEEEPEAGEPDSGIDNLD